MRRTRGLTVSGVSVVVIVAIVASGAFAYAFVSSNNLGGTTTGVASSASTARGVAAATSVVSSLVTSTTVVITDLLTANITASTTATQLVNSTGDVVQSCSALGNLSFSTSCILPEPVTPGDLILVAAAEVSSAAITQVQGLNSTSTAGTQPQNQTAAYGFELTDSLGDDFAVVGQAPGQPGNTYTFYYFVATATNGGTDNVTLTGSGRVPFIFVHELTGVGQVAGFSSGRGTSDSASVTPYIAPAGSFTLATIWVENNRGVPDAQANAGPGNTFLDTAFAVTEEYSSAGGNVTSPFAIGASIPWGEISVSFS